MENCVLCAGPFGEAGPKAVNGRKTCAACFDKIMAELAVEGKDVSLGKAFGAGMAAAVGVGLLWGAITKLTGSEIGYAAVGVGYAAGKAVHWASGGKRSRSLQKAAVACAVLGLILGKYFSIAFLVKAQIPEAAAIGIVSPRMLYVFAMIFPQTLDIFDALWLFLAVNSAWRVPKPTEVQVADGSGVAAPAPAPPAG